MEAVIFDMDGVVLDTERYWPEHEREIFREALRDPSDVDAVITAIKGRYYREIYDAVAAEHEMTVDREQLIAMYEDAAEEIYTEEAELMDGVAELVADVRDRGEPLALVTSSPHSFIDLADDRFGIRGWFDVVVSAEDLDRPGKPEPYIYEHAAERLGVDPENCLAVEDSRNGATAAARAGMYVIGYDPLPNQDLSVADVVVDGPAALRETLLDLL